MKKFALIAIAMLAMGPLAKAQLYVGGSLNISGNNSKEVENKKTELNPSSTTLGISPEVGFFLSDNFAVGVYLESQFTFLNDRDSANPVKTNRTTWGIAPYARWYAIQSDKFGVFLEGQLFFLHNGGKTTAGNTTVAGPKTNAFGLNIVPGLSYNLTDNLQLQMRLDVLGANFTHTTTTTEIGNDKRKDISNNYGLNINTHDALRLATVSFGFIYKF